MPIFGLFEFFAGPEIFPKMNDFHHCHSAAEPQPNGECPRRSRSGGTEGGKEGIFWTGCTGLTGWEGVRFPIGWGEFNAEAEEEKMCAARGNFRGFAMQMVHRLLGWGCASRRRTQHVLELVFVPAPRRGTAEGARDRGAPRLAALPLELPY